MPFFFADRERRAAGLRDHHTHRRAFQRMSDAQLGAKVEEVIEAWSVSFQERPLRVARDWHPREHFEVATAHFQEFAANPDVDEASRDALDFLLGRDSEDGSRCGRQVRALGRVLRERGLHAPLFRLAAWCAALEPEVVLRRA